MRLELAGLSVEMEGNAILMRDSVPEAISDDWGSGNLRPHRTEEVNRLCNTNSGNYRTVSFSR